MTQLLPSVPKLAIVVHTEEEFDWSDNFNRQSVQVTHGEVLNELISAQISEGVKFTLAMDYPFVTSDQGLTCIDALKGEAGNHIEFATQCHPWVNPPFENDESIVEERDSYPGKLSFELEQAKIATLTKTIESACGHKPITYLAGRYGVGENTHRILRQLGYKIDVSISPFADFRHQQGPDFSAFNNTITTTKEIVSWPHTSAVVSLFGILNKFYHQHPTRYRDSALFSRLKAKLLRARLLRLSPEGFSLADMKNITQSQQKLGQEYFILSFHSPSVKAGLTPYVQTDSDAKVFQEKICQFTAWFKSHLNGEFICVNDILNR